MMRDLTCCAIGDGPRARRNESDCKYNLYPNALGHLHRGWQSWQRCDVAHVLASVILSLGFAAFDPRAAAVLSASGHGSKVLRRRSCAEPSPFKSQTRGLRAPDSGW